MKVILDARKLESKKESHIYLKEAFHLPEYYGHNLDALHDCLEEMKDLEVEIENEEEAGAYFRYVKRVLEDL